MESIWKFRLIVGTDQKIEMPVATMLSVQMQNGQICVWAMVMLNGPKVKYTFNVVGTGFKLDNPGNFIGTVQDGSFVWHVFYK